MSPLLKIALYLAPDIIPSQLKHAEMLPLFPFSVWDAPILPLSVDPVLGFSPVVRIGTPPLPRPQENVPSPLVPGGDTLACGGPNSDEGTGTVVLKVYKYVLCARRTLSIKIHAVYRRKHVFS